jgi:hypothetical protein
MSWQRDIYDPTVDSRPLPVARPARRGGLGLAGVAVGLGLIGAMAWALPGRAHEWYSQACCSGIDCAPIPASAVTWTPNGWRVALNPGQHPMVTLGPMVELVPFAEILPSEDDQFHACVRTDNPSPSAVTPAERIICLYIPEGQFGS